MEHPFRTWRTANKLSLDDVADRLAESGARPSPDYLGQCETGHGSPSWGLSKRLAALTKGDLSAASIKDASDALLAARDAKRSFAATSTPDAGEAA